jgi:hypothetical protein
MVPSEKQASKPNKYGSQLKLSYLHGMRIRAHPSSMLVLQQVLEAQDEYYNNTQDRRLYTYTWKMHMHQHSRRHIYIHEYKAKTYKNHAR